MHSSHNFSSTKKRRQFIDNILYIQSNLQFRLFFLFHTCIIGLRLTFYRLPTLFSSALLHYLPPIESFVFFTKCLSPLSNCSKAIPLLHSNGRSFSSSNRVTSLTRNELLKAAVISALYFVELISK